MAWIVVVGGTVLLVACVAWFLMTSHHPENAASHADDRPYVDGAGRGTSSPDVLERPAGPDAENMSSDPPNASPPRES